MNERLNCIALCAGAGMLDEGLRAGLDFLGMGHRTVLYVEREAYAAAVLAARMEGQSLDAAPVWPDLTTLDATRWAGKVDCIVAGFPCQPHSVAGSRKGVEDERWIWPDIARIIADSGAWLVWLENVPGLLSSGGFGLVIRDLAEMGFAAEYGCLSAASVGASHRRERVFILAYRGREHINLQQRPYGAESARIIKPVADTKSWRGRFRQRHELAGRTETEGAGQSVANAQPAPVRQAPAGGSREPGRIAIADAGSNVGNPERTRRQTASGRREYAGAELAAGKSDVGQSNGADGEGGGA